MSTNKPRTRRRWPAYLVAVALLWLGVELVFDFFPDEKKEFRQKVRTTVENTFPEQAAEVARTFRLTVYGQQSLDAASLDPAAPSVVLIHGLDDPGKVWMNLAPRLAADSMNVLEMRYPNDQPIRNSAQLFHEQLQRLRQSGVPRIAIVAHSMGGLVSREMLTNPRIAYMARAASGEVPHVVGFIMVGTPNHGSEVARFRVLGEIRDQWSHVLKGQGHILRGVLDGAGEAKIDLLPGSRFLTTLNGRPHPEGVRMLSIAGVASPWDEKDIVRLIDSARDHVPAERQKPLEDLGDFLKSMTHGLGDGLVTVESTRLDGVDHRIVNGTHLSMIRNLTADDPRIPPAVPIVAQTLGEMSLASPVPPFARARPAKEPAN